MKLFDGIKEKLGALGGAKGLIYIAAALAAGLLCLFLSRGEDGGQDTSAVETAEVDYRGEGGYSRSSPPVVEEKPPRVGGVAIVCEGGDNPAVQKKVIDLVCALYGIPSSRVSVSG